MSKGGLHATLSRTTMSQRYVNCTKINACGIGKYYRLDNQLEECIWPTGYET